MHMMAVGGLPFARPLSGWLGELIGATCTIGYFVHAFDILIPHEWSLVLVYGPSAARLKLFYQKYGGQVYLI